MAKSFWGLFAAVIAVACIAAAAKVPQDREYTYSDSSIYIDSSLARHIQEWLEYVLIIGAVVFVGVVVAIIACCCCCGAACCCAASAASTSSGQNGYVVVESKPLIA